VLGVMLQERIPPESMNMIERRSKELLETLQVLSAPPMQLVSAEDAEDIPTPGPSLGVMDSERELLLDRMSNLRNALNRERLV
jgi:hypothetical protein